MATATAIERLRKRSRHYPKSAIKRASRVNDNKGVCMVFEATITTPAEDRDGDTLHPEGANIDPQSALLWQHNAELPIGKLLGITEQSAERLAGQFAIADTDLGRDAATLVEMGALRISHGYLATEFDERPGSSGARSTFDVKKYDVIEVSLVSVPANTEAVVTAFERKQLKSMPMCEWAKRLRPIPVGTSAIVDLVRERSHVEPRDKKHVLELLGKLRKNGRISDTDYATAMAADKAKIQAKSGPISEHATATTNNVENADVETDADGLEGIIIRSVSHHFEKELEMSTVSPDSLIAAAGGNGGGGGGTHIRVKGVDETFYSTKRHTVEFHKSGHPIRAVGGGPVEEPSQFDKACMGAWIRHSARKSGIGIEWTEHDQALLDHMVNKGGPWNGDIAGEYQMNIAPARVKAILDDSWPSGSGGSYINPFYFDDMLISPALLSGELLPFVDVVPIPRASSVHAGVMQIPTVSWSNVEGTQGDEFDTSNIISLLSSTVHAVTCFLEVGLDWLSDVPVNVGEVVGKMMGERLSAELDSVLAVGDGSTQPLGFFNTPALNTVISASGSAGPMTIGDIYGMMFGIAKQYRRAAEKPRFVCSDTMYRHVRSIAVATNWNLSVFDIGMKESQGYHFFEYPVSISNDTEANYLGFAAFNRYRLYRRLGLELRWSREGYTLMKSNTQLMSLRARYAGQFTLPAAGAAMYTGTLHS